MIGSNDYFRLNTMAEKSGRGKYTIGKNGRGF
jgi:hypothetical protein